MNQAAKRLKSFARGRETAYRVHQRLTVERSHAISKIKSYCEHFGKSKAYGWIKGIEREILMILPSDDSKHQKTRVEIQSLLDQYGS